MESVIKNYLNNNRRIVIPEFGAFLKKEDGNVIFVPFLNKDDGILNAQVRQFYGVDNSEASTIISQFVSATLSTINTSGYFSIEGLGTLKKDTNGIIFLEIGKFTPPVPKPEPKPIVTPKPEPNPVPVVQQPQQPKPQPIELPTVKPIEKIAQTAPKKKTDILLVLAIIVALIAIGVMVYGYFIQDMPVFNLK